jgi:hypothetical protein
MEQSQETASNDVGMSCDLERLNRFIKKEQIIFIDPKGEYNPIPNKEVSLWK